jgi:hypothetical protein
MYIPDEWCFIPCELFSFREENNHLLYKEKSYHVTIKSYFTEEEKRFVQEKVL